MPSKSIHIFTSLVVAALLWLNISDDNRVFDSAQRDLQGNDPEAEAEYDVPLRIFLDGGDDLLELIAKTPFLKAGLDQSVKDFLNQGCSVDSDIPSYYRVDLDIPKKATSRRLQFNSANNTCVLLNTNLENAQNINCYVTVKSKCKGKRNECRERVNERFLDNLKTNSSKEGIDSEACFSNPLEFFNKRKLALATFEYSVGSIADPLDETIEFDFKIGFDQGSINLRDEVGSVSAEAGNPIKSDTDCTITGCPDQRNILQDIYKNFGLELNDQLHECEHPGINCNEINSITHIWLGKTFLHERIL